MLEILMLCTDNRFPLTSSHGRWSEFHRSDTKILPQMTKEMVYASLKISWIRVDKVLRKPTWTYFGHEFVLDDLWESLPTHMVLWNKSH